MDGQWPNEPKNNEFVREWAWDWTFNELGKYWSQWASYYWNEQNKQFEQEKFSSVKSKEDMFI